jgi:hypothetical protein
MVRRNLYYKCNNCIDILVFFSVILIVISVHLDTLWVVRDGSKGPDFKGNLGFLVKT